MPPFINEEDVKAFLATVLDTVKQEGNPELLTQYRSLFRKQVPFFMRSWVAAYLIQQTTERTGKGNRAYTRNRKTLSDSHRNYKNENPAEGEQKKQNISEEESTRIFISIGRNRRVFPREILSLILSETGVKKEDIGLIRILDNYSFVQVRKECADTIIEALNGKVFRGRTLTVNHARSKNDESTPMDTVEEAEEPQQYEEDTLTSSVESSDESEK